MPDVHVPKLDDHEDGAAHVAPISAHRSRRKSIVTIALEIALIGTGVFLGLAFLLLIAANHWLWVLPAGWCAGFGYYMLHNTLQINATQMAPQARGTAVSLFASFFFLGQSLGVWFAAIVIDRLGVFAVFGASALLLPLMGVFFSARLAARLRKG